MKPSDSSLKNVFIQNTSISSSHSVIAEFNINSYFTPKYYGSYNTSGVAANTFVVDSGYTNGINKLSYTVDSSYETQDDWDRKSLSPLEDCFMPNRPDPGILRSVAILGFNNKLINSISDIKQSNYPNADARIYPLSSSSSFKYWNSYRYNTSGSKVGISDSSYIIADTNPFVVYDAPFKSNKINIVVQKDISYPTVFTVQYLNATNNWVDAYVQTSASNTHFADGKLTISYNGTSWSIVTTESDYALVTDFSDTNTQSVTMKGVRLVVSKLSTSFKPLELIEISPRLIVDLSSYVLSSSHSEVLGEEMNGLPVGSIVSGTGSVELDNSERWFDSINSLSIFTYEDEDNIKHTMLNQNVKFTLYQNVTVSSTVNKIKLATLYSTVWESGSDYTVTVSLEDYIKIFRETKAPNLLLGFSNQIKTSVAIRMLLDNVGFNKFIFNGVTDNSGEIIDPGMNFFYCSEEFTVAEVLNDIAKTFQISFHMDYDNNLVATTKEKVVVPEDKDFWLVGEPTTSGYAEHSTISNYKANIESFDDEVITPITSATASYKILSIKKNYVDLLKYNSNDDFNETIENVLSDPTAILNKKYSYVPKIVWQLSNENNDAVLLRGIIKTNIPAVQPKDVLINGDSPATVAINENNENDAARWVYSENSAELSKYQIELMSDDLTLFLFSGKYKGYLYADSELIRYNGIKVSITDTSTNVSQVKYVYSAAEMDSIRASAATGSKIQALALMVALDFKFKDGSYYLVADGRGQEGTTVAEHSKTGTSLSSWNNFSTVMNASSSGSGKAKDTLKNGSLTLQGPASKTGGKSTDITYIPISTYSQRFIYGKYLTLGFDPTNICTRMRIIQQDGENKFHTAGFAFYLSDSGSSSSDNQTMTGYFIELNSADDPSIKFAGNEKEVNNIRLYRVSYVDGKTSVQVLGAGNVDISTTASDLSVQTANPENGKISTFKLQVIIVDGKKDKTRTMKVYWEGKLAFTAKDKKRLSATKKAGVFVRDDSRAVYDYLFASTSPTVFKYMPIENIKYKNSFNSFGNDVKEAIKVNAKFDSPVFKPTVLSLTGVNPEYIVKDFKASPFGCSMWVKNTAESTILLAETSNTPLYVSGLQLEYITDGEVSFNDMFGSESEKKTEIENNKKKYGDISLNIQTEYLNSMESARDIVSWVANNSSKEKRKISMSIFPNPLLEVGDKVGCFYPNIGYNQDNIGNKTYVIAQIDRTVGADGPEMNIVVREC